MTLRWRSGVYIFCRHLHGAAKAIHQLPGCRRTAIMRSLGSINLCRNELRDGVYKINRQCMKTKHSHTVLIQAAATLIRGENFNNMFSLAIVADVNLQFSVL